MRKVPTRDHFFCVLFQWVAFYIYELFINLIGVTPGSTQTPVAWRRFSRFGARPGLVVRPARRRRCAPVHRRTAITRLIERGMGRTPLIEMTAKGRAGAWLTAWG